jgi:hypothetical protein
MTSFNTPAGQVFMGAPRVFPKVANPEEFKAFVLQTGQIGLLGNKVSSTALKAWMEENANQTPPGISVTYERTLNVRRP